MAEVDEEGLRLRPLATTGVAPFRDEAVDAGLDEIAREALARVADAKSAPAAAPLPAGGQYAWRADGERHLWTAQSISALQQSTRTGDWELY